MDKEKLLKVIEQFKDKKILVIGDLMLDKYIWGEVSRISPEAPVQVVNVLKESYGTAILDGEFIVDFQEKPKQSSTNIVNAGIYIFKPEIFELFENVNNLEKDLFPKLARMKQLIGFFTYGEYLHLE